MLALYLHSVPQSALAVPFLLVVVAAATFYFTRDLHVLGWLALSLAVHTIGLLLARRAASAVADPKKARLWRRLLLASTIGMGACWALFLTFECELCNVQNFKFAQGTVLLIALATMAMSTVLLRGALLAGFLPVVITLGAMAVTDPAPPMRCSAC